MYKKILLSFLLLLFTVSPALAAGTPAASIYLAPNKHYAYLTFSSLKNVSKVSYTLTYETGGRTKGIVGGFKTNIFSSRSVRRQIIGTCSTRFCTYHVSPRNFSLTVTFTLRSGATTTITKQL